jgi:hypothetical protein
MAAERRRLGSRAALALAALTALSAPMRAPDPFAVAPADPPRVLAAGYFGTHFHRLGVARGRWPATDWPGDQVGALRLWDSTTRWADLEPEPGRFDFARLDASVAAARAHGADVLLVLGSPPRWASARPDEPGPYGPGSAAEPRDPALWDRYVEAVVRRCKGRVEQYELWNEPYFSDFPADRGQPGAFFTGSAATMVELARRTRAVLQAEDPQARLLTPGFVGAPHRLERFLDAGGGAYVDAVAYHFYADDDEGFAALVRAVRAAMDRRGLRGRPLIDTESGFAIRGVEGQPAADDGGTIDRRRAAALLARTMVLGAWLGLERFYQYAWDNGRMGMLGPDGRTPTDSLAAWTAVRRWLTGTTLLGCASVDVQVVRCEGRRDGRGLVVAWRRAAGSPATLQLPEGLEAAAVDGVDPPAASSAPAGLREIALPADGMPVAVWTMPAAPDRHGAVKDAR